MRLIVSDKYLGLYEIIGDSFPEAKWQRCIVHWYRNAFTMCPRKYLHDVVAMLKAIHAQEDKEAARQKVAGQKIASYEVGTDRKFYKKQCGGNVDIYGLPV